MKSRAAALHHRARRLRGGRQHRARQRRERARVAQAHNKVQLERDQGLFKTGMLSQQDLDNATASAGRRRRAGAGGAGPARPGDAQPLVHAGPLADRRRRRARARARRQPRRAGRADAADDRVAARPHPRELPAERDRLRPKYPERFRGTSTQRDLAWAKKQFAQLDAGGRPTDGDHGRASSCSRTGAVYPHRGVIVGCRTARSIASTGTIQIQALFPNPDGLLRPGQYGQVRISAARRGDGVLAVPEKALVPVQGTYSLAVVGADNKVQLRRVERRAERARGCASSRRASPKATASSSRACRRSPTARSSTEACRPIPAPAARAAGPRAPSPARRRRPRQPRTAETRHVRLLHSPADRRDGHRHPHGAPRRRVAARACRSPSSRRSCRRRST